MINLKFEIRKVLNHEDEEIKTNIFKRFIIRIVCNYIIKSDVSHYQFAGWDGSLKINYVSGLADKYQLVHWLLNEAGYSCCGLQIMERCGIDYKEWEAQEMGGV